MKKIVTAKQSILISRVLVYFFTLLLIVLDITGWWIGMRLEGAAILRHRMSFDDCLCFIICLYTCSIPAYYVLYSLHRLLVNIASGKVFIDGTDMHALKEDKLAVFRRRQIGLVYQFYNLMPVLNVDENIALPHLLDGRELDRERLDQIVAHLGLSDRRENLPHQLSGGQQQRVSIGRALYSHPAILLCDEPTGNLDRKTGEEIVNLLKESNRSQKQTLLLITHDEALAMQADRMIYLEDGRLVKNEVIRGNV